MKGPARHSEDPRAVTKTQRRQINNVLKSNNYMLNDLLLKYIYILKYRGKKKKREQSTIVSTLRIHTVRTLGHLFFFLK